MNMLSKKEINVVYGGWRCVCLNSDDEELGLAMDYEHAINCWLLCCVDGVSASYKYGAIIIPCNARYPN